MVTMHPRPDGILNVTREEIKAAREQQMRQHQTLVREDGTLTSGGQIWVSDRRARIARENSPEQIARDITNPILGRFPDFGNEIRPVVIDAIKLGIETDRGYHAPADPDPEQERRRIENLKVATLNVYAPTIIAKLKAERGE